MYLSIIHVIYVLFRLAKLERERGDVAEAKKFLEEAYVIADETNMHDRAILYLGMKAEIAESEKNYEDAFRFTKEIMSRQAILDSLSEGVDMEKYHIQLEREKLAGEKQNQALKLAQRQNQLMYTTVIVVLVGLLALGLFISLRKQRQAKWDLVGQNALIIEQSEQLKTLDAAKSRFFANVSHELRTPLTLILGSVKMLLQENQLTPKQARLLQMTHKNGQQLEQLINEILDLRKLELAKMEVIRQPIELVSFFRNSFAQFGSLAQRKQINFSFETTVNEALIAEIDQAKCRQIINNLLSNAFKFTPEGGRIKGLLSFHKDTLQLEVADSGPGIHPDDLPHGFDRFFQTSRPDKPAEGGTGIGLNLCYEYALLFGGNIEVESTLGKGAVLRVAVPVTSVRSLQSSVVGNRPLGEGWGGKSRDEKQLFVPNPATTTVSSDDSKPTILVVKDNPELQDYIRLILDKKYNILTADNGRVALDIIGVRSERRGVKPSPLTPDLSPLTPDLILSDLMMPVMDGYQLLENLKGDDATRHIPVIMLTARAEARDKLKALRIGVDDYLTKPFDEEELLARIENLLKNRAVRELAQREEQPGTTSPVLAQSEREWLADFETYVQAHISDDALSISFLAQEYAMSESSLLRQVTRLTGLSPKQYLQEVPLHAVREMLENKTYSSVSQVAAKVGYTDTRTFSRSFRRRFGKLPSEV